MCGEGLEMNNIEQELYPAFNENNIPIIFNVDNKFVPYLCAVLASIIENSTSANNYDIVILEEDVTFYNKHLIKSLCVEHSNFAVRFCNIKGFIDKFEKNIFYTHAQFSITTYYRLFISEIFKNYSKVVYLDSDIVVLDDIANLYKFEMGDNLVAATPDIQTVYNAKVKKTVPKWNISYEQYLSEKLNVYNHDDYFQAGVLLFNIDEMKKTDIIEKFIDKLKELKIPSLVDQDILNAICYEKVAFFDPAWNHLYHIQDYSFLKGVISDDLYVKFDSSRYNPKIIHFTSEFKPWFYPKNILANYFWKYARKTPFYESVLFEMMNKQIEQNNIKVLNTIRKEANILRSEFKQNT